LVTEIEPLTQAMQSYRPSYAESQGEHSFDEKAARWVNRIGAGFGKTTNDPPNSPLSPNPPQ
jgi:hypothetical protein